ncbi:MAG: VWA domain-containing protein [Myxococcales bacterium]|nr:VWA domain-containing protein [Myxococcales bacterium]
MKMLGFYPVSLRSLATGLWVAVGGLAAIAVVGCDASSVGSGGGSDQSGSAFGAAGTAATKPGSHGVTQAGAQDFGAFRQILEAGKAPAPGVLDDLGFFAEHKLDYPKAACGDDLCMHGLVGSMANMINGANCTLVQIGLNTPLDPQTLPRPPLDLVLVIDTSGSMQGDAMTYVKEGLKRMLDSLEAVDRVSLVTFSTEAQVAVAGISAAEKLKLAAVFAGIEANGSTNLYDGLFMGFQVAAKQLTAGRSARVVMLSDGKATAGIQDNAKLVSLARSWAKKGIGITTIGMGAEFDVVAMRDLAEAGGGNFYFIDKAKAAGEVFQEEVKTAFLPLALDVKITFAPGPGYVVRAVYGTHGWNGGPNGGIIEIPALYLAKRTDSTAPITAGRRGGGGAIVIEMVPLIGTVDKGVASLGLAFVKPADMSTKAKDAQLATPHKPGEVPPEGFFSAPTVEKGFVMLNLFAAFEMATQLAWDADPGAARGVLEAIVKPAKAWVVKNKDPDIEDDLKYVAMYTQILADMQAKQTVKTPVHLPPDPWPFGD